MGTPAFAVTPLRCLVADGYEVAAVYTRRDKPAGRGQNLSMSPVKQVALELGLPVVQPASFKSQDAVDEMGRFKPDAVVVAAYGQILPPQVLKMPRWGCLNIHPSLLPKYRGVSPVASAILAGDDYAGVSVMLLDEGTDTGPIFARAQVPILDQDTTASLTDKLSRIGSALLLDVLPRWVRGTVEPQPQDHTAASYSRKLTKEDGRVDWTLPAVELWRRIRAFTPWPGAYTTFQGRQLKILAAVPASVSVPGQPGLVVPLPDRQSGFGVVTGGGVLAVASVQYEGKRPMPAADFLRGQRAMLGALLGQ